MGFPKSDFRDDCMAGKTVLVTGGHSGIGFGICETFGRHGAKLVIGGRRKQVLEEAVEKFKGMGIEAAAFQCDVRDFESCQKLADQGAAKFGGKIDVLVNCAAGNFSTSLENITTKGVKTVMEIDFIGTFNMSKAALPHLKKGTNPLIINISATLQKYAFPFQAAASSAKSAIDALTANIGVEWAADYGIRCVGVAPGPIEGTVGGPGGRVFGKMMEAAGPLGAVEMQVPIARYGTVYDIGFACLFAATPSGSLLNATTLIVDGGQWHPTTFRYKMGKQMIDAAANQERKTHKGGVKISKL